MDEEFPYERDAPPTNDPSAEDTTVSSALGALLVSAGAGAAAGVASGVGAGVDGVETGAEVVLVESEDVDGVEVEDDACV